MQKLLKITAWSVGTFLLLVLSLVIYMGKNRIVVIADTGSGSGVSLVGESGGRGGTLPGRAMAVEENTTSERVITIPVEASVKPENIVIENQYADKRLVIFLGGASAEFYDSNVISGHASTIEGASYTADETGVKLYLALSELYDEEGILETGVLQINLYEPEEKYDKVVVLDSDLQELSGAAGFGAEDEEAEKKAAGAVRSVEEKIKKRLEEEGIRVYSASEPLSGTDAALPLEQKLMIIERTGADLYVGIAAAWDADPETFGTYVRYNKEYFMPSMTNGQLADLLEKELVTNISGKALGLEDDKSGILEELTIPAAVVYTGYISHPTEGLLLQQESYQDKIAEGISQGILNAYEKTEEAKE